MVSKNTEGKPMSICYGCYYAEFDGNEEAQGFCCYHPKIYKTPSKDRLRKKKCKYEKKMEAENT
jgi:hypothetical protein